MKIFGLKLRSRCLRAILVRLFPTVEISWYPCEGVQDERREATFRAYVHGRGRSVWTRPRKMRSSVMTTDLTEFSFRLTSQHHALYRRASPTSCLRCSNPSSCRCRSFPSRSFRRRSPAEPQGRRGLPVSLGNLMYESPTLRA